MNPGGVASLCTALVLLGLAVLAVPVLLTRRLVPLIRVRYLGLLLGQLTGILTGCLTVALLAYLEFRVSCFLFNFLLVFSFCTFLICTILRVYVLWFKFNLTKEVLKLSQADSSTSVPQGSLWFAKNRRRISQKQLLHAFLFTLSIVMVPFIFLYSIEFDKTSGLFSQEDCKQVARYLNGLVALFSVSCAVTLIELFRRLWKCQENFGLFQEAKITALAFAIFTVVALLRILYPRSVNFGKSDEEFFGFYLFGIILPGYVFFYSIIIHPLVLSYRQVSEILVSSRAPEKSMKELFLEVLSSPEGFSSFRDYLVTQFSVENLMFYNRVCHYRSNFDSAKSFIENARRAWDIYLTFFPEDSLLGVNISSFARESVVSNMEPWRSYFSKPVPDEEAVSLQIRKNLFDISANEVFRLMLQDSFREFQLTENYRLLAQGFTDRPVEMLALRKGSLTLDVAAQVIPHGMAGAEMESTSM